MSKRASPTAIGAFVVGAVALIVAGALVFGSGQLFRHSLRYALFFNTSVEGLSVGAPVQFRGVKIGQVSRIEARWGTQWIEVVIDVDPRTLLVGKTHSLEELVQEIEKSIKESGLRAQLRTLSLLTGQLFLAIDLFPNSEIKLTGLARSLPEIPVVPTTLQIFSQRAERLMDTLASLPLPQLIESTAKAVEGINKVVITEFPRVMQKASSVLGHTDDIVRTLSDQEGPLLASAKETLDSTRGAVTEVSRDARQLLARLDADAQTLNALLQDAQRMVQKTEGEIGSLGASVRGTAEEARAALEATRRTLEKAQATLGAVDGTLGGDTPLGYQFVNTLQELAAASRSIRTLADYLDQHPEALLKGKGNPGGK
ncbi:MAG: MlaD family protein [candidate division NC10 bacterium]|nr:MlaD family protein [candidate division NC10 bacterium]